MTVTIIKEQGVTRPVPDRITSTVLDHATVVDLESFGLRNNEGLYPSYNCLDTLVPTAICPDPLEEGIQKTFAFVDWVPAFEFAVHGGVQCKALGLDSEDQNSELRRVFGLNEGKGVEMALLLNRFVALVPGSDDNPNIAWDAPVDLTPGSAVSAATALGILEGYAAAVYAGQPTLHLPRSMSSILNERIVWEGDKAFTRGGAKVAFGGGYDSTDVPDGTYEFYATGEVYVERSDMVSVNTFVLPGDGSGIESGMNGLSDNTSIALAERAYRVGVDCFTAQITATVWE